MIYPHTNNGRYWLIVAISNGGTPLQIREEYGDAFLIHTDNSKSLEYTKLPAGTYGTPVLAKDMSEEQARKIVKSRKATYWDYPKTSYFIYGQRRYDSNITALFSLNSLLASLNLTPETAVIIEVLK